MKKEKGEGGERGEREEKRGKRGERRGKAGRRKKKGKYMWWRKGNSIKSFKTLHTGSAKKRASRQGKAAEGCREAAPKAPRAVQDDGVLRAGAGG